MYKTTNSANVEQALDDALLNRVLWQLLLDTTLAPSGLGPGSGVHTGPGLAQGWLPPASVGWFPR